MSFVNRRATIAIAERNRRRTANKELGHRGDSRSGHRMRPVDHRTDEVSAVEQERTPFNSALQTHGRAGCA
ncbi:MAG: hypothetical protein MZU91_10290 [Desulfosudis oleivorans]|nr:hypothetical protein [Desulfosudis oleivorans]